MRTLTFNRLVGAGAMGSVYHAELRTPGGFSRTCAVKVMKQAAADHEHFLARMRDEARLLGMLQDESVLGVSELVAVEGRDAVIMEFVEGVDLADIVEGLDNGVPPKALAELGAELAGTLYRAHGATHPNTGAPLAVIHRDVKPANVMITSRGSVKLLDFGVARAAFDSRESQTQGLVLGTLNYFPPEILAGQDPTPAVDIYGLGLTMWECAAAKQWGAPRVQQKRFNERVARRMSELPPNYSPLLPVLRKVFAWDPAERPDGKELEGMLLDAAENASGQGLRTWSRAVVPGLLKQRLALSVAEKDNLVGRTIQVQGLILQGDDEDAFAEGSTAQDGDKAPSTPPPKPQSEAAAPASGRSYDDLGPPAAAKREPAAAPSGGSKKAGGGSNAVVGQSTGGTKKKKKKSGPSVLVMAGVGVLVGGVLGIAGLGIMGLVVLVLR